MNNNLRQRAKWVVMVITILLAFFALWQINRIARQIRISEEQKVRIWANAIGSKAQLVAYTDEFFEEVAYEERLKMELYSKAIKTYAEQPLGVDVGFYYNYIEANHTIPVVILDNDSVITAANTGNSCDDDTLVGKRMTAEMLSEFLYDMPVHYNIYGMPFTLYYKESRLYSDLRNVLGSLNQSLLYEITNNSVFVPVIITDTSRTQVLGYGNLDSSLFNSEAKLAAKLREMERENTPIEITLPSQTTAYVFYESTPLLTSLRWIPLFYVVIAIVLLTVSYFLFRTARTMEQNRIWVGMAKETAHQLGTPISSLMAWTEYLEGKTLDSQYAGEIKKDLNRLETVTQRFSKIGSVPELSQQDVVAVTDGAIEYLAGRTSKKVTFNFNHPDHPVMVPLNTYLFQWVIENLCKNAVDAMSGEGILTITLVEDEKQVVVEVSDTGKGMPSSVQKHIFESGYTTKQRGWGLGLSLARRIVNDYHKGKIYLKNSVEDQGSTFRIELKK
ncbi:MAG: HAMP domain-containing histidine kinase [Bacteroidales bacterium]|nr:HAMP domain-containing histidine kinase [Bacteroidales bacterium]